MSMNVGAEFLKGGVYLFLDRQSFSRIDESELKLFKAINPTLRLHVFISHITHEFNNLPKTLKFFQIPLIIFFLQFKKALNSLHAGHEGTFFWDISVGK